MYVPGTLLLCTIASYRCAAVGVSECGDAGDPCPCCWATASWRQQPLKQPPHPPTHPLLQSTSSSAEPPASLEELFRLWGLDAALRRYHGRSLGIDRLYPWQAECLALPGVAAGERDLLYFAPTSGGKTMVAELLMLLRVMGLPMARSIDEGGHEAAAAAAGSGLVPPAQQRGMYRCGEAR